MKTIIVTSQKGGAGKTTIARSLAVAADAAGHRVGMIDLDPQKSLREWWEEREADTPQMFKDDPAPKDLPRHLDALRDHFDMVIIDTAPRMDEWLSSILKSCDLAVIPVRASPDDLRAVRATLKAAKKASAPFVFVLSQVTPGTRIVGAALARLAASGRVAPVQLAGRVSHPEAAIDGRSAAEVGDAKAAAEIACLWEYIEEVMNDG